MKIIVTGAPGVGKTSIMEGLAESGWKIVNFGSIMLEIAKEKYGIADRDDMRRKIKVSEYKKIQAEAAGRIAGMGGDILVDTHMSIFKNGWYYPGLPVDQLALIKPDGLLVVEAGLDELRKRREKDKGVRKREEFPDELQEMNRYYASAYSAVTGAPVFYIHNKQGRLNEAIEAVKKACKEL